MIKGFLCECGNCKKEFIYYMQMPEADDLSLIENKLCPACEKLRREGLTIVKE
jgi:hypothetical protein